MVGGTWERGSKPRPCRLLYPLVIQGQDGEGRGSEHSAGFGALWAGEVGPVVRPDARVHLQGDGGEGR